MPEDRVRVQSDLDKLEQRSEVSDGEGEQLSKQYVKYHAWVDKINMCVFLYKFE